MDTVPQNVISGSSCTRKNLRDIAVVAQAKIDLKGVFAGPRPGHKACQYVAC